MSYKISFLMAAHNEEKIIGKTIKNLSNLPWDDYEVLIGLDGCTDKTEEIVKNFCSNNRKFKYYRLNIRKGKPAVINKLIKYAKGKIIVINDADWIFRVKSKRDMKTFFSVFSDLRVGGIGESFSIQYPTKNKSFLEAGIGVQTDMWINYAKSSGQKFNKDWIVVNKSKFPLLVNIFRKELYKENKTLADDFERFFYIVKQGKLVLATNKSDFPRMVSVGENYTLCGIYKQKERTALARKQINFVLEKKTCLDFFLFVIKKLPKLTLKEISSFLIVNLVFFIASLKAKFRKNITIKEGWKMRLKR